MQEKDLISVLKKNKKDFHPVVPIDPVMDKLVSLDFTTNNKELVPGLLNDTKKFTSYINDKLSGAGARYGLGGYAEQRNLYSVSKVFDAKEPGAEPRRLHLGVDIWGKPYTKVMAPLDAIVHSFAFNNEFGDYGATIILSHFIEGLRFFTLYGHLSLNSIKNMREGDNIAQGDVFGEFGIPVENGHWPPHLHFQLIIDIEEGRGDYPGVCRFSEKEKYLANCPDPDLILQLNQYV